MGLAQYLASMNHHGIGRHQYLTGSYLISITCSLLASYSLSHIIDCNIRFQSFIHININNPILQPQLPY